MKRFALTCLCAAFTALLALHGCDAPASSRGFAKDTRIFVDSAGRSVEIPARIDSAAPSGPLAQIVLYTAAPEKLAGLASDFSEGAKRYIDEKYWSLPKFGQFYGKNASLNMEALAAAAPDVIVDIGEAKATTQEDMDILQAQLGIPAVFIEAALDTLEVTYKTLGELLGEAERAEKLASYCRDTVATADAISKSLAEDQKIRVYMAMGDAGLNTNAAGSFHADVLSRVGAVNVADIEVASAGGGSEVSFEQILVLNPDVILVEGQGLYRMILKDAAWMRLDAVKEGRVRMIPNIPYSFIGNPPSVNQVIGINWLGSLLYPDEYKMNIRDEVAEFYKLFYSIDLSDDAYRAIVNEP